MLGQVARPRYHACFRPSPIAQLRAVQHEFGGRVLLYLGDEPNPSRQALQGGPGAGYVALGNALKVVDELAIGPLEVRQQRGHSSCSVIPLGRELSPLGFSALKLGFQGRGGQRQLKYSAQIDS